jgi:hypothetical protein
MKEFSHLSSLHGLSTAGGAALSATEVSSSNGVLRVLLLGADGERMPVQRLHMWLRVYAKVWRCCVVHFYLFCASAFRTGG